VTSPKAHLILADFLWEHSRIPPEDTATLLQLVHAHDDLIAFGTIAENLTHILPLLKLIEPKLWNDNNVCPLITVAEKTTESSEQIARKIEQFTQRSKRHPLHGIIGSHPCYCVFWYNVTEVQYSLKYQYLQAIYLHAQHCFDKLSISEHKDYGSIIGQVGVRVRKTATDSEEREFLGILDKGPYEIDKFYVDVKKLLKSEISTEYSNHLILLERLVRFVIKEQGGHKKKRQDNEPQPADINFSLKDSHDENTTYTFVRHSSTTKKEADAAHRHGCASDESYSGPNMLSENKFIDLDHGQSFVSELIKTRNKARYMASANQLLTYRWERMNYNDVSYLLQGLDDLLQAKINIKLSTESRHELAAFIAVIFWTSSPPTRALNTRLIDHLESLPKILPENTIYISIEDSAWAVAEPKISRRKFSEKGWNNYFEPTSQFIVLPMGGLFKTHLSKWGINIERKFKTQSIPFFTAGPEVLEKNVSTFIKKLLEKQNNIRLTPTRISSYLLNWCADYCKDTAGPAYIFGRIPPAGQKTPLYYYTPKITWLRATYTKICRAAEPANSSSSTSNLDKEFPQGRIGSNICPRKRTVRLLIKDLAAMVKFCRNDRSNLKSVINFHNAYTNYCVTMLGFATGYRIVRDPLTSLSHFDIETGSLVISDKDHDDNSNAKITFLTKKCCDQIKEYKNHREAMADHLSLVNPDLARELRSIGRSERLVWSRKQRQKVLKPFFFYLKDNYQFEIVTYGTMEKRLKWTTKLPLNINRHYLRTCLCENGVSGEVVDAFMGHWDLGREPFGKFSSLSPEMFHDQIEDPLKNLFTKAGWEILPGIG